MNTEVRFVLASTSPRRRELLHKIIPKYEVISPDVREICNLTKPSEIVVSLAIQKGQAACKEFVAKMTNPKDTPIEYIIISADTLVAFNDKILGKPQSKQQAFEMLTELQEKWHSVFSGVAIFKICPNSLSDTADIKPLIKNPSTFYTETKVLMASRTHEQTINYINGGSPMDKAGSYGIQDLDGALVKKIIGSYDNVMGLPTEDLKSKLQKLKLV